LSFSLMKDKTQKWHHTDNRFTKDYEIVEKE